MDKLQSFDIVEQWLLIVVVTRTRVVNWWVVNSLASRRAVNSVIVELVSQVVDSLARRRAGVIDLKADSDLWNYFIKMVGQVSCINSVIVELVSRTDLKEYQTIEVILIVRGMRIIIVTFTFISFKLNLLLNNFFFIN